MKKVEEFKSCEFKGFENCGECDRSFYCMTIQNAENGCEVAKKELEGLA